MDIKFNFLEVFLQHYFISRTTDGTLYSYTLKIESGWFAKLNDPKVSTANIVGIIFNNSSIKIFRKGTPSLKNTIYQ